MKGIKKIIAVFLLLTLIFAISVPVSAEEQEETISFNISGEVNYDYAFEVLERLNSLRERLGIAPLKMDYNLMNDAMLRAAESSVYFSHTRPNGEKWFTALTDDYFSAAENIAAGQPTPKDVMSSWQTSSGHYANMKNSSFTSVGIGCFKSSNGYMCWVQLFNSNEAKEQTVSGTNKQSFTIEAKKENLNINLSLDKNPCSLKNGEAFKLSLKNINVEFPYVTQVIEASSLSFTSSDEGVLSFFSDGTATINSSGVSDITVASKNDGKLLWSAQYDSCHIYNDCCETECIFCVFVRTAPHSVLPAPCDQEKVCSLCGITVSGGDKHQYSGAGDAFCNICNEERTLIYVKGDADGDQTVSTSDLALLKLYLAGSAELESVSVTLSDLNSDSTVNTGDLADLKLFLAGVKTF